MTDRSEEKERLLDIEVSDNDLIDISNTKAEEIPINNSPEFVKFIATHNRKIEIRNLLERLRVAWEKMPELNLSQLIIEHGFRSEVFEGISMIVYTENEALITAIERMVENGKE